mmetsp:Transcript_19499/g.45269  ORF Transcript_19499/g.45269 Transcript_19499/m.45269 type:complete len:369 (+) Transcript_19499:2523-3629(+)
MEISNDFVRTTDGGFLGFGWSCYFPSGFRSVFLPFFLQKLLDLVANVFAAAGALAIAIFAIVITDLNVPFGCGICSGSSSLLRGGFGSYHRCDGGCSLVLSFPKRKLVDALFAALDRHHGAPVSPVAILVVFVHAWIVAGYAAFRHTGIVIVSFVPIPTVSQNLAGGIRRGDPSIDQLKEFSLFHAAKSSIDIVPVLGLRSLLRLRFQFQFGNFVVGRRCRCRSRPFLGCSLLLLLAPRLVIVLGTPCHGLEEGILAFRRRVVGTVVFASSSPIQGLDVLDLDRRLFLDPRGSIVDRMFFTQSQFPPGRCGCGCGCGCGVCVIGMVGVFPVHFVHVLVGIGVDRFVKTLVILIKGLILFVGQVLNGHF